MNAAKRLAARRPRLLVALFFAALTLIGLMTSADYGMPCDEPAEQVILRENLHEYAVRLLGEQSEAVRYYEQTGINRISRSIERDHGESAYYLFAPLLALCEGAPDTLMTLWHAYTWLVFMLGAFSLYALVRFLGVNRPIAAITVLLYVICPRFFAEGHYNNKDIALLTLVLLTLWQGARLMSKPTLPRALLFSLAGAMAANTKVVGAFAWALMGLCVVVRVTSRREWSGRVIIAALAAVAGFALAYSLITPALLADPRGYFEHAIKNATGFTRWTGVVIFKGERYEPAVSPLPHSYLPYLMLVTLPLYVPPLCAAGQLAGLKASLRRGALKDERALMLFALTLLWLVPLAFVVWRQPVMYNGWRHFYFIFAGLAPMMALGLRAIWGFTAKRGRLMRRVAAALLAALVCYQGVTLALNHPYQYGYYNVLARGDAETDMELDYWDVSTVNAMRRLCAGGRDEALPLTLGAHDEMSFFGVEHGYEALTTDEKARLTISDKGDAPYLFENTTYALIYGTDPPEGYRTLFTITSYGNALCTVYEKIGTI